MVQEADDKSPRERQDCNFRMWSPDGSIVLQADVVLKDRFLSPRSSAHVPVRQSRIFLLKASAQQRIICSADCMQAGDKQRKGFPGGSDGKESACNAEDPGLIPGLGRSPGKGNGYPLQYSCLGNPWTRGT